MEIIATKREKLGKQNRSLRRNRQLPAVIYGVGVEPTSLTVKLIDFVKLYKEAGETALVDVNYDGTSKKVLIKEVQIHPVNLQPIHVSFHKVDLTEKIKANIPVEIVGEEESPIVKSGEGLVLVLLNEIEVEALPSDLPPHFTVDISHLTAIDQAVTVAELKYDKSKVEIVGAEQDDLVVKIDYAEMAEEVEEVVDEAALIAGMEVLGEKPEEEGEEGAAGAEDNKGGEKAEESKDKDKEKASE